MAKAAPPSELVALQQAFQSFIRQGSPEIYSRLAGAGQKKSRERLQIYAQGYRQRLVEVLQSDFPTLCQAVGQEAFGGMVRAYLEAFPSQHRSVRWLGEHLSKFLRAQQPFAQRPWLAELAKFEWALLAAFDAQDDTILGLDSMAAVPPEAWPKMRIAFHSSVQRLDLQWNVATLRKSVDDGCSLPNPTYQEGAARWLVWRHNLALHYRSLAADEAWALDAARCGRSFDEICEGLCDWGDMEQVALRAAGLLKGWVVDGLVSQVRLD